MKSIKTNGNGIIRPSDEYQAAYWNGPVTRGDFQKVLDQINPLIKELITSVHGDNGLEDGKQIRPPVDGVMSIIAKLDMALAFVMDKIGANQQDFMKWQEIKMREFEASQALAKANAEKEKEEALRVEL